MPLHNGLYEPNRAEARQEDGRAWLSLHDASYSLGIPPSSLRRYLDRHGRYIPTVRSGKKVLVARSALPVLERIRMLYDAGRTVAAVEDELGAAAFVVARDGLRGFVVEAGDARSPSQVSTAAKLTDFLGAGRPAGEDAASAETTTLPVAELGRQVAALEQKIAELQVGIESRDLMIRQVLSAMVQVVELHGKERRFAESERRIADNERDRDAAHRHQQLMLSIQEILNFTRRRRWPW